MTSIEKEKLYRHALLGLPGSDEPFTPEQILSALKTYHDIDSARLKKHLFFFLKHIVPVAEELSLKLAIHPDDPPYSILGLPRVGSPENDLSKIPIAVPSIATEFCFSTGSL